jgi:hypothetical protein
MCLAEEPEGNRDQGERLRHVQSSPEGVPGAANGRRFAANTIKKRIREANPTEIICVGSIRG